jgi:hypothetical protein
VAGQSPAGAFERSRTSHVRTVRPCWASSRSKDTTLTVYRGAPHGLTGAYEQAFNADLLAFLDS